MEQKKYYFRPKRYGYGLFPISWEGWLMTLGLVLVVLFFGKMEGLFGPTEPTQKDIIQFLVEVGLITFLFVQLSIPYTDGKIEWNWGKKN